MGVINHMRLLTLSGLTLVMIGSDANAQTPSRDQVLQGIEECKEISVDFMRTACLQAAEQFLANTTSEPERPSEPAIVAEAPEQATDGIAAERAALAKERAEIEQARAALEAENGKRSENERRGVLARLGLARNKQEKNKEKIAATITIDRITYNKKKIHRFYTSDGDILLEDVDNLRMRLPSSLPATATFEQRFLGSKWITFTEHPKRSYKVKIITPQK